MIIQNYFIRYNQAVNNVKLTKILVSKYLKNMIMPLLIYADHQNIQVLFMNIQGYLLIKIILLCHATKNSTVSCNKEFCFLKSSKVKLSKEN